MLNVKNRAISTLASGISDSDLSLTVATGEGVKFPEANFHITIEDEIMLCTSRTSDVFTIVREQEDTTASAHDTGKAVQLRITAAIITELQDGMLPLAGGTMAGNIAFDTTARTIAGIANGNLVDSSTDTIASLLAPTADFSMNTHKITGVVDPTADQDAATYFLIRNLRKKLNDESLILYLPFDKQTGTVAKDISRYGNDGTFKGAGEPAWDLGFRKAGVDFDGTDDYISVGTMGSFGSSLSTGKRCIFAGWVQSSVTDVGITVMGTANVGSDTMITIHLNDGWPVGVSAGIIGVFLRDEDSSSLGGKVNINTGITDGNWHHLTVNVDGPNNLIEVYLDGVLQTFTYAYQNTPDNTANFEFPLYIGAENSRGTSRYFFDGKIDEVRIYNRALSAKEVYALYKNPAGNKKDTVQGEKLSLEMDKMMWTKHIILPSLESLDGWSTIIEGTDADILLGVGQVSLRAGDTVGNRTLMYIPSLGLNPADNHKNPLFQTIFCPSTDALSYYDWGVVCGAADPFQAASDGCFGFKYLKDTTTLYAFVHRWTGSSYVEQTVVITGIGDLDRPHTYRAELRNDISKPSSQQETIKYYVDGVLKATIADIDCEMQADYILTMGVKSTIINVGGLDVGVWAILFAQNLKSNLN